MQRTETAKKLQAIFDVVFFEDVVVSDELSAKDVDEWDSITHINIILAVEQEFKIRFSLGEVEKVNNVGEFIDLVRSHL
ncbi:acyl carrier protein [Alphaproteobacteria bacterium]|nr:acyl carrier protein [Alphaproteobacteria bacterium]